MSLLASIIVVGFGLFLIGLAAVVFTRPTLAERFLTTFASSARAHYIEQAFRLLIGLSLVVVAPVMWQPQMFRFLGWAIVLSSSVLILLPWRWHQRFGALVLPGLVRHMKLYAVGLFALACLLLYSILFPGSHGTT